MKKFLPAILIALIFILSGCGNRSTIVGLQDEIHGLLDEIQLLSNELTTLEHTAAELYEESADLQQKIDQLTPPTDPRLSHGLYTDDIKAAFLANEDFHIKIAGLAGFRHDFPLEPMTITDRNILFPRGLVSYHVDRSTQEITWSLVAYELDWMGWRHVRESPTPRRLTNYETVTMRVYSLDGDMAVYLQETREIPGQDLWHELTQMWGIRDVWYTGDILHVDFHPHMEMAFNVGLGSLFVLDTMMETLFSLPNVANIVFTLDGGPMMHAYLGVCLNQRRFLHHEERRVAMAGYVTSIVGNRDYADWTQIHLQKEDGDPVILVATMLTLFPMGDINVGDFITGYSQIPVIDMADTGDIPTHYFACLIVPGAPEGLHVTYLISGMGTLSGYYVGLEDDFVMAVNASTAISAAIPHAYRIGWREERGLGSLGVAVLHSTPTMVNGRRHVVANEVFILNHSITWDLWGQSYTIPETFALSDFEVADMNIYVQGVRVTAPPVLLHEDTVMVPLRAVAEGLSYEVSIQYTNVTIGDNSIQGILEVMVLGEESSHRLSIRIGDHVMRAGAGGTQHNLPTPALIVDGIIYVPFAFFDNMDGVTVQ